MRAEATILHADLDAFYASVEQRDDPALRGKPVIVGGGVVLAASYEARAFGVRSAMPGSQARRLCPQAVFLPPDMAAYAAASGEIMRIFADVTPLVEPLSVDEAFLDVSGALRLLGRPRVIADHIRERVRTEQGLTCSVGVAATKYMAKLASGRAKPDGVLVVPAARTLEFLHPLPVEVLWGVGERTCEVLRRLGLRTVGDVAQAPPRLLRQALGDAAATHLHELARGRDPRRVSPERVEKSAGAETTFDEDVADPDVIRRTLLGLATGVARRLRRTGHAGRTVAIKVRLADFRTLSRSRTLPTGTDVAHEIFSTAWQLFQALAPGDRIRLIGVRVEGLAPADALPSQPALGSREHGWRDAERAADAAADRFGGLVMPASLLGSSRMPDKGDPATRGTSGKSTAGDRSDLDTDARDTERAFDPLSDPLRPS